MREILFRGKRIDNYVNDKSIDYVEKDAREWVYGDIIHRRYYKNTDIVVIRTEDSGFDNYSDYEVDPETVGQYTGLTDKNGRKIFEGDICNISIPRIDGGFNRHNKCLCSYEDGMYKFSSYSDIYFCMGNGYGYPDTCHQNIEVIDNIHDNPKLLNNFKNQ